MRRVVRAHGVLCEEHKISSREYLRKKAQWRSVGEGSVCLDRIYKVPPATYCHAQLRNLLVYCKELDCLLYHSTGTILALNLDNQWISEFFKGSAQCLDCKYGYLVFATNSITVVKVSTKESQQCLVERDVNSVIIVKEEGKIYVIATYNGGMIDVVEIIEKENQPFALKLETFSHFYDNINCLSCGSGEYSEYYACGRDGQESILILKASKGFSSPQFSVHSEYPIGYCSSSIATKWLPNSSKILTGTEAGIVILSDIKCKAPILRVPNSLPGEDCKANAARIIKSGQPYISCAAIAYSRHCLRILNTENFNQIQSILFVGDKKQEINGMEFVMNRLYVMVGSFLYCFSLDNRVKLALTWPASFNLLSQKCAVSVLELILVLKQMSIPLELIHLILKKSLLQWPLPSL
eukprot:TRINITY_DN9040_c0_g1_i1.p1 TRINITY_DN9040_c0_g1~~TRINITY_DN9040_c0_g1_i1.p1  ORF type:complete len:409 (+),score=89.51 TRINITY_DN9040_c0_g1_i1:24-1250(+)